MWIAGLIGYFPIFSPTPTPSALDLGVCLTFPVRKHKSLGSIRVIYLLSSQVCCCNWLFSTTTSIQPHSERVLEAFLSPVEFKPSFGLCQILYPCQRLHLSQTLKCNYYDLSLFGVNKILPGIFSTAVCSWEKSNLQSVLSRAVLHMLSKLPSFNQQQQHW